MGGNNISRPAFRWLDADGNGRITAEEAVDRFSGFTAVEFLTSMSGPEILQMYGDLQARSPETAEKIRIFCSQRNPFCPGPLWKEIRKSFEGPTPAYQGAFFAGLRGEKIDLHLYATFLRTVPERQVETLLENHKDRIPASPKLTEAVRHAARDGEVFELLREFFAAGGTLGVAIAGGRFIPPNKIIVGRDNAHSPASILIHELLHWYFHSRQAEVSRLRNAGGADHAIILPLQNRYDLLDDLQSGFYPQKTLENYFGQVDWDDPKTYGQMEDGSLFRETVTKLRMSETINRVPRMRQAEAIVDGLLIMVRNNPLEMTDRAARIDRFEEPKSAAVEVADLRLYPQLRELDEYKSLTPTQKEYVEATLARMTREPDFGIIPYDPLPPTMQEDALHMEAINVSLLLYLQGLATATAREKNLPTHKAAYASATFREKALPFVRILLDHQGDIAGKK